MRCSADAVPRHTANIGTATIILFVLFIRALAAYKDFLTLWKDTDPDIPILKQAKAEYARLQ